MTGGSPAAKDAARLAATAAVDAEWQNGFYIVTGLNPTLKDQISTAIKAKG